MGAAFVRALIRRIVSGQYPVGSLIPTESELGAEFGVSRTVIREGTKVLADKGLVLGRRGHGTVVQPNDSWRSFDPDVLSARLEVGDRDVVLREVLVLRRCIEPELAAAAATSTDDVRRARLQATYAELDRVADDPERYKAVDEEFHARLADLGGIAILNDVLTALRPTIRIQRDLTGHIPGGNPVASHRQHSAVFSAVMAGDADAARTAMAHHLTWAEDRLHHVLADPGRTRQRNRARRPRSAS